MLFLSEMLSLLKKMKNNPLPKLGFSYWRCRESCSMFFCVNDHLTRFLHNVVVGLESEERCCVYSVTCSILWKQPFFLAKRCNKQNQNAVLCVFCVCVCVYVCLYVCVCPHKTDSAGKFLIFNKIIIRNVGGNYCS